MIDKLIKYIKYIEKTRNKKKGFAKFFKVLEKYLQTENANINAFGSDGYTALTWAASEGNIAIVRLLLNKGAAVDAKNQWGDTPLIWGSALGHTEVAKVLLQQGANIDMPDQYSYTPLGWAVCKGYKSTVELLIERGARVVRVFPPSVSPQVVSESFLYASLKKAERSIFDLPIGLTDKAIKHNNQINKRVIAISSTLASTPLNSNVSGIVMGYLFETFSLNYKPAVPHSTKNQKNRVESSKIEP